MNKLKILILLTLLPTIAFAQKQPSELTVRIESGLVQGINQEGTQAFLGIQYAKVERFMPPLPVEPWDTIMQCNHWGPQAMQNVGNRQMTEAEMSENSCVLNETMIFDHNCYIRNNPDRKLSSIINDCCFKQLKEFYEKKAAKK